MTTAIAPVTRAEVIAKRRELLKVRADARALIRACDTSGDTGRADQWRAVNRKLTEDITTLNQWLAYHPSRTN
jgi:hypothetical protein